EGNTISVALTSPIDPSSVDTAAGFHYAFAVDGASLTGVTYASAGRSAAQSVTFNDGPSNHTVTERILDKDGSFTDYIAAIQVNNVAPTATLVAPATVNEGSAFSVALTSPIDPSSADTAAGFHYAFATDGTSLTGVTYASAAANAAPPSYSTLVRSNHTVTERILDKDGSFTDYIAAIQVNNVAPTATLVAPATVNEGSAFSVA